MSTSNIRAFVQWKQDTIYAGESIECTITFKNIAPVSGVGRSGSRRQKGAGTLRSGERHRRAIPSISGLSASQNSRAQSSTQGHRPALSLTVPVGTQRTKEQASNAADQNGQSASDRRHSRSVSIVSLGSTDGTNEDKYGQGQSPGASRTSRSHARSASLQTVPKRPSFMPPLNLPSHGSSRSATQPSPLFHSSTPSNQQGQSNVKESAFSPAHSRQTSGTAITPSRPTNRTVRQPSGSLSQTFKFPPGPQSQGLAPDSPRRAPSQRGPARSPSPRSPTDPLGFEHLPPVTRILSGSSMNGGTPRSSGEFYSISNHSSETLASEYQSQASHFLPIRPNHLRRQSHLTPPNHQRPPETLMMGYAQVIGSFALDGSLVNQGPFEEVKRKGVLGGQGGGGVVGVERNKRESGLLGALGWGSIGTSIGDLLGGGELSTVKEMRGIASSKEIPLLSTPQSILFVDLRLAPGESKTYSYSFQIPNGLPPTHKGRAIKTSYNLIIGTQRAGTVKDRQQMRQVDVPFRVFGSVNSRGETLGHDLMSPYIFLKDNAVTKSVDDLALALEKSGLTPAQRKSTKPASSQDEFVSYVEALLSKSNESSTPGLLSPTVGQGERRYSDFDHVTSTKESIDLAILRSNQATSANRSSNRFEIARNGRRVAVVMLARPAFRLGETVTAMIDFDGAEIPTYAVHTTLESAEKVDGAIALRSPASVDRVTKKIHASHSESTLYARRVAFTPTIPVNTTPDFFTSGISLEWRIRIEFVTPHMEGEEAGGGPADDLLEEVDRDSRGVILAAVEDIRCTSFDIEVPIRVFGSVPDGDGRLVGGLVV